jgi:hypothetical protein
MATPLNLGTLARGPASDEARDFALRLRMALLHLGRETDANWLAVHAHSQHSFEEIAKITRLTAIPEIQSCPQWCGSWGECAEIVGVCGFAALSVNAWIT